MPTVIVVVALSRMIGLRFTALDQRREGLARRHLDQTTTLDVNRCSSAMIPFLDRLNAAKNVLIAGCGGGFDVYAGMPIATYLAARGVSVVFANLSFSRLEESGAAQCDPVTWRIESSTNNLSYFPEKWMVDWLSLHHIDTPMYAFTKTGVRPLRAAFQTIVERHMIDLIVLIDGGTDSVIFGDEPGLGTVVEDATSIVAATEAAGDRTLLAAIGFGIDHFHGISHYAFLENVARLSRDGGFLGGFPIIAGTSEAQAFLELVDYANRRQPRYVSIVCNSIASAIRGEFGNYQFTNRTSGTELFINPLMTQYWAFKASHVVSNMTYAAALSKTETYAEAALAIETHREQLVLRSRRPLPL